MLELARTKDLDHILAESVSTHAHLGAGRRGRPRDRSRRRRHGGIDFARPTGRRRPALASAASIATATRKNSSTCSPMIFSSVLCAARPVAAVLSEELHEPMCLHEGAPLAVAIDPLDGSSNIDANVSIGTIFSILPAVRGRRRSESAFPAAGPGAIGSGILHLWAADGAGARPCREDADLHPRSAQGPLSRSRRGHADPAGVERICHQCLELSALGALDPGLHRRLRERDGGTFAAQPQYALDRLARRRGLSHLESWRRVSLSGRFARRL